MKPHLTGLLLLCILSTRLCAADQPQWGHAWTRNQVSAERDLPSTVDPSSTKDLLWRARMGTETHSTPVIGNGRVFIGTNNNEPRDPKHQGDRGVLLCLEERTGKLLWQLVVPKRFEDPYFDWPNCGIPSPATLDGDRVYVVSNRGEVVCLDAKGLSDGNDGPFQDEAWHMSPPPGSGEPRKPVPGATISPEPLPKENPSLLTLGPLDADILWIFDMVEGAGIWPHDGSHSSILVHGDLLYLNTGTGVDNTHKAVRRPEAPSLIVLDKHSGRFLAREREGIAPAIFHCTWSSPSMAKIGGEDTVVFAGGNGVLYGFAPLAGPPSAGEVLSLKKRWEVDLDPNAPKSQVHQYNQNRREGPSNVFGLPVLHDGKVFVASGGDVWWGKNESWLKCIDPTRITQDPSSGVVWSSRLGNHVVSSPAIHNNLVFITDTSRFLYCFDAQSGNLHWRHEAKGDFWASPYVADNKVFVGSRRGDFWVFQASKDKSLLSQTDLGAPISATAVAANRTLYVATMFDLFAFRSSPRPR